MCVHRRLDRQARSDVATQEVDPVLTVPLHLDGPAHTGQIGHVRKTSFAEAKAHLSELVDAAEHKGARILILRHGKPAAALVPARVVLGSRRKRRRPSDAEIAALHAAVGPGDHESAVADLLAGRR